MKKIILLLSLILLFSKDITAKYRRVAIVKYETQSGWSQGYKVEVTFMTGYELNQATRTFNYNSSSVYATIFWGNGGASVIKLTNYLMCGLEVTSECIDNTIYPLQGADQDGDKWKICLSGFCL